MSLLGHFKTPATLHPAPPRVKEKGACCPLSGIQQEVRSLPSTCTSPTTPRYIVRPGISHAHQTVRKSHAVGFGMCTPEHTLKGKQAFQGYRAEAHSIVAEFGTASGERVEGRGPAVGIQREVEPGVGIVSPKALQWPLAH